MASKTESNEKSGGGLVPILIAALLTALAGLGFGFGVAVMFIPENSASKVENSQTVTPEANAHEEAKPDVAHGNKTSDSETTDEAEVEVIDPATIAYVTIPDVVTNLTEPRKVWIRLEAGIAFVSTGEKKPDILAAETSHQIAQYLRTLNLKDIEGPDSLQFVQEDLNKITNSLSNGQVQRVLISGLVVE